MRSERKHIVRKLPIDGLPVLYYFLSDKTASHSISEITIILTNAKFKQDHRSLLQSITNDGIEMNERLLQMLSAHVN